jgi:glycosyltransferase involved in cell wall biosynthesis
MGLTIAQVSLEGSAHGGVGAYLLQLYPALAEAGHRIIAIHADRAAARSAVPGACQTFYVEDFGQFAPGADGQARAARVLQVLDAVEPDVVHVHWNNNFALDAAMRARFGAVKTLHDYDFCPSGNKYHHASGQVCRHATGRLCLPRMGYKRCLLSKRPWVLLEHYRRCVAANRHNAGYRKLLVASHYVKQQAMASGYPADQLEVLPYFTDLPELSRADQRQPTVLFVGRVVAEKGLDELLRAFALVRSPSRLVVVGDGRGVAPARDLARRLDLGERVEFAGWVRGAQLARYYREAAVLAVPSRWPEPFGIVGIEAMSYGLPVVAFRVGGIPEWLEDGVTGFLCPPGDVTALARRLEYLLQNPAVSRVLGRNGRQKVEREFGKDRHIAALVGVYRDLLRERVPPVSVVG